jgi:hypothetical protein
LHHLHFSHVGSRSIIEAMQMQKPMDDVQLKLARQRIPECAGVPSRCLGADKNLTVVKRQNVGWSRSMEEFSM